MELIYIIYKSFLCKNEKKKDTSSKKLDNFPKKHTEIEHNSQKFISQNTVFLGFILNRIKCENERVLNKIAKILPLKTILSVWNYLVLRIGNITRHRGID